MTVHRQHENCVTISMVVRKTGLSPGAVQECVARRLVSEPPTDAELRVLRRIRRLQELGVNLPGIEIILHMRQRIQALEAELTGSERPMARPMAVYAERQWRHLLTWDEEGG